MSASERINEILKYLNINARAFSERLGYQRPQVIYDIQKGKTRGISDVLAEKIRTVFPDINNVWLLTGEGEMLKKPEPEQKEEPENKEYLLVPLVHIDSVGGMGKNNDITDTPQYVERLIPFEKAQADDLAIYQSGVSMSPTIPAGSILQIRQVPDWQEYFGYGDIYVLELTNGRRITKEISSYAEDPQNYVLCVSHNPNYPDEKLPRTMIRSVWKVVRILIERGW